MSAPSDQSIEDLPNMETHDPQRHQIIKNLISPLSKSVTDDAIRSWERLATQIISILGVDGFDSLYTRSFYLNQAAFPWLAANPSPPQADFRFAELKRTLEGQTPAQASEANCLLLIIFTDILASLIGEQITTHLLRLSWDVDISKKAISEEFKNE